MQASLHIERHGHGPEPVVLLHGWAMHGGVFAPLLDALATCCTLYVVDLPGHGHSRHCDVPLELRQCARAIAAATPPAIWLGWSLGGLIALQAALQRPRQVRALAVICASPCFVRKPDWPCGVEVELFRRFVADLELDYRATLIRFLALEALGSTRARADARELRSAAFARGEPDKHALQAGMALLESTDLRADIAHLSQPSVWIAGARDRLVAKQAMLWGANQCAGQFACIDHAGHAPFLGSADKVANFVRELLPVATL